MEIKIRDEGAKGYVNNVLIKDNTFENFSPNPSDLRGLNPEHVLNGVKFDNLVIAGKQRTSLTDAKITINDFVRNLSFSLNEYAPQ